MNLPFHHYDPRPTFPEILQDHRLKDAVTPLVDLATNQPALLEYIIQFAMTMGIAAAYTNVDNHQKGEKKYMDFAGRKFRPAFYPERRKGLDG